MIRKAQSAKNPAIPVVTQDCIQFKKRCAIEMISDAYYIT
jgi:hypothetical protein